MLYKTEFGNYNVKVIRSTYRNNNRLAIRLMDRQDDAPVSVLTVNLVDEAIESDNLAFVDTNNNPNILEFIKENALGEFTGRYGRSGYCTYPLYRFDLDKLEQM